MQSGASHLCFSPRFARAHLRRAVLAKRLLDDGNIRMEVVACGCLLDGKEVTEEEAKGSKDAGSHWGFTTPVESRNYNRF